jgi:hypothetical protein
LPTSGVNDIRKAGDMLQLVINAPGSPSRVARAASICFATPTGTWMTRYGSLDTFGLVRTGRWNSAESADCHRHTIASPEARRADLMPVARQKTRPAAPKK